MKKLCHLTTYPQFLSSPCAVKNKEEHTVCTIGDWSPFGFPLLLIFYILTLPE